MKERYLFNASAAFEILTGIFVLAVPAELVGLLFGDGIGPVGVKLSRVLGVGLCCLGLACWEPAPFAPRAHSRLALCGYNFGAAIILAMVGFGSSGFGAMLWPSSIIHFAIGTTMLLVILNGQRSPA